MKTTSNLKAKRGLPEAEPLSAKSARKSEGAKAPHAAKSDAPLKT